MKWILYFLLLALAFASLSFLYLSDPGYMEVTWLGYKVQLSAVIGLAILLFLFFVIDLLRIGGSWLLEMPYRWVSFFRKGRERKAKNALIELVSSFEADNLVDALAHQKKGRDRLSSDPLFLWISGNAFEKAENLLEAEKCFVELTKNPLTSFLGLKGLIRAALHRGDSKLAYTLLECAEKLVPTSPWVLKHLLALAREKKNFERAGDLILSLEDLGYFSPEKSKKQIAYLQYLQAIQPEISPSQKEGLLRQSHGLDPSLTEATEALVHLLWGQGHTRDALRVLEATWLVAPTQKLGDLYLKISTPKNEVEAYQNATHLIKQKSRESLLLLARTALKAKLWGEARAHLTDLLTQDPIAPVYYLLATLELGENHDSKTAIAWLERSLSAA